MTTEPLDRRLGPFDAAAIIVSNVIGAGILFTPPRIAALVPNAALFLSTWVAALRGSSRRAGRGSRQHDVLFSRLAGVAPDGLRFELGLRSGGPPLAVYRSGEVIVA